MAKESYAIIGAGAVGSYYGARLVQGGQDVHFLVRSDYEALRRHGMRIRSCAGDLHLPAERLNVYREPGEMPKVDWVIVALKTTSNHLFEPLIGPLLKDSTAILTIQNGLGNEEALARLFGAQRILGGVAFTCINRTGPAEIEHTAHGRIRLGEFVAGDASPRSARIAATFNACGIPCDVLDSLAFGRWEKLVWNVPFNGLSTALDQTTDRLLATEAGESLARRIMAEVIASARACGVALGDQQIDLNISRTREMGAYLTSMHIDRRMGRELEVEAVLGEPYRAGAARGVANPCMQMLYELVGMVGATASTARISSST
jgi:2-dehydropantoate 2-reductase